MRNVSGSVVVLFAFAVTPATAQETMTAGRLGLDGLAPDVEVLVLDSDPTLEPVRPVHETWLRPSTLAAQWTEGLGRGTGMSGRLLNLLSSRGGGPRMGCPDEGYSTRGYARDSGNDWPWLPANTIVADDLTLEPGTWIIGCYDVLIYADNDPSYNCDQSRTVTLCAYDDCNGAAIPGSDESWAVPPHGGPVLLTGVTSIEFQAAGTIWFAMTTSINECDGWYLGQTQVEGSTANVFQLATDCDACINPPSCNPWAGFIVILYGCRLPEITSHPEDAVICTGGWHQFCVIASGSGTMRYQWQLNEDDIDGATSPCYVATEAGSYRCIVSDDCGSTTSDIATLTLSTGPTITSHPIGGKTCPAALLELCVAADGIGEMHYQWKRNGLNLIGAVLPCYTATQDGTYWCVVTDDCGSTASETAAVQASGSGDFDGNHEVDLDDIGPFVAVLLGTDTVPEHVEAADTNCNDVTDGRDVLSFVELLLADD
ncbi:MAG: hypothetical protein JXQ75_18545 [Phycisphaerae bacterium]|nr:hypothetical protein [Phycisphaerae bacterium]